MAKQSLAIQYTLNTQEWLGGLSLEHNSTSVLRSGLNSWSCPAEKLRFHWVIMVDATSSAGSEVVDVCKGWGCTRCLYGDSGHPSDQTHQASYAVVRRRRIEHADTERSLKVKGGQS
jgi:hypothetical protein